jgi:DNA excision repair protein ERCC-5
MKQRAQPLFDVDSDEDLPAAYDDDTLMQVALQESLESQENADLQHALEASRNESQGQQPSADATSTAGSSSLDVSETVSDGDELNVPGRLETVLAIANAGPTPKSISMTRRLSSSFPEVSVFNTPKLLVDHLSPSLDLGEDSSLEYFDEVDKVTRAISVTPSTPKTALGHIPPPDRADDGTLQAESVVEQVEAVSDSDEDMELVPVSVPDKTLSTPTTTFENPKPQDMVSTPRRATKVHFDDDNLSTGRAGVAKTPSPESSAQHLVHELGIDHDSERSEEEHVISDWSRSPSPVADALATEATSSNAAAVEDSWDAAQEMDPHAEEGEFARFLSQVKGKDLDDVRREIDDEIKTLNRQKKVAMRDSEDITQQMIAQIMVRS